MAGSDSAGFWISLAALVFSGFSLLISFVAFRRTSRYQAFEYTPRLQISRSPVHFGSNTDPRFELEGSLQNKAPSRSEYASCSWMWAIPKTERSSITASSRKISSLRGVKSGLSSFIKVPARFGTPWRSWIPKSVLLASACPMRIVKENSKRVGIHSADSVETDL